MITVRPFAHTEQDFADMVHILNATWTDYIESVAGMRHSFAHRTSGLFAKDWLIDLDGRPVGYGYLTQMNIPNQNGVYRVDCAVHPDWRGHGAGQAFLETVTAEITQITPKPTQLMIETREEQKATTAWLERLGCVIEMRFPRSTIDVTQFDKAPFAPLTRKLAAEEIEIKTLEQLAAEDAQAEYKLWELVEYHIRPDMPMVHEHVIEPFEQAREKRYGHPEHRPDGNFIALHHGEYVGVSSVWGKEDPNRLFVGITGTKKTYRRKGIATALKVKTIEYAQKHGFSEIETDNEENNPMFDINMQLGFTKQPSWLLFKKDL